MAEVARLGTGNNPPRRMRLQVEHEQARPAQVSTFTHGRVEAPLRFVDVHGGRSTGHAGVLVERLAGVAREIAAQKLHPRFSASNPVREASRLIDVNRAYRTRRPSPLLQRHRSNDGRGLSLLPKARQSARNAALRVVTAVAESNEHVDRAGHTEGPQFGIGQCDSRKFGSASVERRPRVQNERSAETTVSAQEAVTTLRPRLKRDSGETVYSAPTLCAVRQTLRQRRSEVTPFRRHGPWDREPNSIEEAGRRVHAVVVRHEPHCGARFLPTPKFLLAHSCLWHAGRRFSRH